MSALFLQPLKTARPDNDIFGQTLAEYCGYVVVVNRVVPHVTWTLTLIVHNRQLTYRKSYLPIAGMRFFHRSADFRLFWTKTIISEIDANPGKYWGGTHKLSLHMGGRSYLGSIFRFFFISPHSHPCYSKILPIEKNYLTMALGVKMASVADSVKRQHSLTVAKVSIWQKLIIISSENIEICYHLQ